MKPQVIKSQSPLDFARVASAVALLGVVAAWSWAMADSNSASQAEAYWHKAKQAEKNFRKENWAVTNENFADLISLIENAVQREPDNVLYRYRLNAYRWRSISRVRLPKTGNLVFAPSALQSVRQIVDDLQTAALGCATFGPNYSLAGELRLFILNDEQGGVLIRRGYSLAPNNPTACFADALLDAQEGKLEDSLAKFRRAVVLNADMFRPAVGIYIHQMGRPDLALQLAEGDVTSMMYVASVAEKDRRHEAIAKRARTDAIALLRRQCDQPDAKAPALARMANICLVNNDYMAAASYFRRALTQDFGKIAWRLNFARALAGTGRVPEAIDQAGICLELTPNASEAKRLIAELRVRPEAIEHN